MTCFNTGCFEANSSAGGVDVEQRKKVEAAQNRKLWKLKDRNEAGLLK